MPTHLITGATGFVGGAIVLELLRRTDDPVVALVRPGNQGASERLASSLRGAAVAYGLSPDDLPFDRVTALAGDVTLPGCCVDAPPRADILWHSAASLRYEDRYAEEITATNVLGTHNALALARASGVTAFNHVSTAYVAGRREGTIAEEHIEEAQSQNHYERSKVAAEGLSRAAEGLRVRILRPSIVVGHSRTLAATTFSGLYGFTRQLLQYRGILERTQPGLSRTRRLTVRATDDGPIDMVPVDAVAAQSVQIGLQPNAEGVYHLTAENPGTIGDAIRAVADVVGFPGVDIVGPEVELDWLDRQFDQRLDFYAGYVRGERSFDRTRTLSALDDHDGARPRTPPTTSLAAWYLPILEASRRQLPAAR